MELRSKKVKPNDLPRVKPVPKPADPNFAKSHAFQTKKMKRVKEERGECQNHLSRIFRRVSEQVNTAPKLRVHFDNSVQMVEVKKQSEQHEKEIQTIEEVDAIIAAQIREMDGTTSH